MEATMTEGASSPAAPKTAGEKKRSGGIPDAEGWYVLGARAPAGQVLPRTVITFGGQSFPQFCYDENPTLTPDTIEYNQQRVGQRVYLYKEDLDALRNAMGKKIVRVRSAKSGACFIIQKSSPSARRALKGDLPLERFIYIEASNDPDNDPKPEDDDTLFPIG